MIVLVAALIAATCVASRTTECADGTSCREGTMCHASTELGFTTCVTPAQLGACENAADRTACAIDTTMGTCYGGACFPNDCGDAIVDLAEACDDGNRTGNDGCSADCRSTEVCGDGVTDLAIGEQCDDHTVGLSGDGCSSRCAVEVELWSDVTAPLPAMRRSPALVANPGGQLLMFGGAAGSNSPQIGAPLAALDDTWLWDGVSWLRADPPVAPPARARAAVAYDPVRRRVVLFGGVDKTGAALGDTWEWDGLSWSELTPVAGPSARDGASLACATGATTRCVLFGGATGTTFRGDAWTWDGASWTPLAATGPSPRKLAAMAYHAATGRFVLFGGENLTTAFSDYWRLDTAWTLGAGPAPTGALSLPASAMYDDAHGTVIVVTGGSLVWTFDGTAWTQRNSVVCGLGQAAWDTGRRRAVCVSSVASSIAEWDGATASWTSAPIRSPTGADGQVAAAFDVRRGRTIVIDYAGTTWDWNGLGWRRLRDASAPHPPTTFAQADLGLAYDPACGDVIAFGGLSGTTPHAETWSFTSSGGWTPLTPPQSPPRRANHAMTHDSRRNAIVVFGGVGASGLLDDTWELSGPCAARSWTPITTPTRPLARRGARMAFDARRGVTVLFGGVDTNGNPLNDTWEWDGTTWIERTSASAPTARSRHAVAYDPRGAHVVMVGGSNGVIMDETWRWDGDAGSWTPVAVIASQGPRSGAALAIDVTGGLTMVGGDVAPFVMNNATNRLHSGSLSPRERCQLADADLDGDRLAGCADPDCYARCSPLCPPGIPCAPDAPRCGDGACGPVEDYLICPVDCTRP